MAPEEPERATPASRRRWPLAVRIVLGVLALAVLGYATIMAWIFLLFMIKPIPH